MPKTPKVEKKRKYEFKNSTGFMNSIQGVKKPRKKSQNNRAWKEQVKAYLQDLAALREYVTQNYNSITWGVYHDPSSEKSINFARRQVFSILDNTQKDLQAEEDAVNAQIRDEARFAAQQIVAGDGAQCGDGNGYILFINVGLGDCTVISSPKGVRFLIDLGSDSLSDIVLKPGYDPNNDKNYAEAKKQILETIRSKQFLGANESIHFMILTHTDADHHNQLGLLEGVEFGRVYYSGANIEAYVGSSAQIKRSVATINNIKQVNLYQDKNSRNIVKNINGRDLGNAPPNGAEIFDNEYIDSVTGAIVLYHEQDTGFKVSILSGNVEGVYIGNNWVANDADAKQLPQDNHLKLDGTVANKRCLVTLIEFNGKKVIVVGDATAVTERFIADQFAAKNVLKDLDVFRQGHHGSLTSSSAYLVNKLTNLKEVVASTSGKHTKLHGLPKYEILKLFPTPNADKHDIYAFHAGEHLTKDPFDFLTATWATGSNGTRFLVMPKP